MSEKLLARLGKPSEYQPENLVTIGKLARPHGLRGELSCLPITDFPERFEETEWVHLLPGQAPLREYRLEGARFHHARILLKFEGIDRVEEAELLRGLVVAVPEEELVELEEGEYYHWQLEGLEAFDPEGRRLGILESVMATPAHEIYAVRGDDGEEMLVPAVPEYVVAVDLQAKRVTLRPLVMDED